MNHKIKTMLIGGAVAGALIVGSTAGAAVTPNYDADGKFDGTGFVGKGDVQDAFGWNNAATKANAGLVSFEYENVTRETKECRNREGTGSSAVWVVVGTRTISEGVEAATVSEARKNKQEEITGYTLTGFDGTPEVTEESEQCPEGTQPNGEVLDSQSGEALYVVFDGDRVKIWEPTPAAE